MRLSTIIASTVTAVYVPVTVAVPVPISRLPQYNGISFHLFQLQELVSQKEEEG